MEEQLREVSEQLMIRFGELSRMDYTRTDKGGLRHGERAVMFCLKFSGREQMKASEIAGTMSIAAPAVTFLLNRLEERGYILREIDRHDRRAVLVSLTEKGLKALEEDIANMRTYFKGLSKYLGEADSRELLRLFERVMEYYTQIHN